MRKLIRGVVSYREHQRPQRLEMFRELAKGQRPDTHFVACSDSRAAANAFASTDPGDLFVSRNAGNLVPHPTLRAYSEAAALEHAVVGLGVRHIIVCGHAGCGAMNALYRLNQPCEEGEAPKVAPAMRSWLDYAGGETWQRFAHHGPRFASESPVDALGKENVLTQLDHIREYSFVAEALARGQLRLHGWFFDIGECNVLAHDDEMGDFRLMDEAYAESLITRLGLENGAAQLHGHP